MVHQNTQRTYKKHPRRIPFSDVYFQRVPEEFFKDKIVLTGGTAPGLFDYHTAPFKRDFPGILIQAKLVNNFINNLKVGQLITLLISFFISLYNTKKINKIYVTVYVGAFLSILLLFFYYPY